jgi:WXG100 family type VII secretion target
MNMSDVNIGYDGLQRSASQLRAGQEEITQRLTSMKTMIDQLVAAEFSTRQASGRFQESYQQWTKGAQDMMAGLDGMATFLRDVAAKHQDLDNQLGGSLHGR